MRLITLVLIFLIALPVTAQSNCGNGLPCGPVPWDLPRFPYLNSPTPADFSQAGNPIVPATPNLTATPTATSFVPDGFDALSTIDTSAINDNMETIEAIFAATDIPITNELGTPVGIDVAIVDNGSLFFSYARGFSPNSFGVFAPLVNFILFAFLVTLSLAIARLTIPILAVVIGVIRKIVQLILDFVPF